MRFDFSSQLNTLTFEHSLLIALDISSRADEGIGRTLTADSMKQGSLSIADERLRIKRSEPAIMRRKS